jgi:hypothetical protein
VLVGEKMVTSWPIKRLQRVCPWHEEVQLTLKNYPGRQSKIPPNGRNYANQETEDREVQKTHVLKFEN